MTFILKRRAAKLRNLVHEVANAGVEWDGAQGYVTVQIDRDTWREVRQVARQAENKTSPLDRACVLLGEAVNDLRLILASMPESDKDGRDYVQQAIDLTDDALTEIEREIIRRNEKEHAHEIEQDRKDEGRYERSVRSLVGRV